MRVPNPAKIQNVIFQMSRLGGAFMHSPAGLGKDGKRLWRSITAEFDLEREPHQVQILAQACRVVDVIAAQDEAAAGHR
jgi:hypothetical protein